MKTDHCASTAVDGAVVELVVRLPKTLPPTATVADARAALHDDHVHLVLITEDGILLGTLTRADLPEDDGALALAFARLDERTLAPDVPGAEAMELMIARGERRRAVVDGAGRLIGLLCLKRRAHGFCSDADVAARAAERAGSGDAEAAVDGDRLAGDVRRGP